MLRPLDGEDVAFYQADRDEFRTHFSAQGMPVCDLIVSYRARSTAPLALVFVELKGGDAWKAGEQLDSTARLVVPCVRQAEGEVTFHALALLRCSAPGRTSPDRRHWDGKLKKQGVILHWRQTNKTFELDTLVRSCPRPPDRAPARHRTR